MKCFYCGNEMKPGSIYQHISILPLGADAYLAWTPEDEADKIIKHNKIKLKEESEEGYYCEHCKKAIGIFDKKPLWYKDE